MKQISKQSGFSLLELSIVLVIFAVLLVTSIAVALQSSIKAKYNATTENLDNIERALTIFLAVNGRLPCPASPVQQMNNNTFGAERIITSSQPATCATDATSGITSITSNNEIQYYGVVPVRSLGLTDNAMFDGWGNRIGYAVQRAYINNHTTNTSCISATTTPSNSSATAYQCFRGQASGSNTGGGGTITINDENSTSVTQDTVYVVISYGENGYGAYERSADVNVDGGGANGPNSDRNTLPTSTLETGNFLSTTYIDAPKSSRYDDILRFGTRNLMIFNCNKYANNACNDTFGIKIDTQ